MTKPKFKYHINHHLSLQPRHVTIDSILMILSGEHGISRDTFYRDRNLTVDDDFSIPSNRLDVYAALFDVTTEALKNYTSKKIKPLSERKLSTIQKEVVKKAKMVKGAAKVLLIAMAFGLSACVSYAGLGKCSSFKSQPIHVRR